MLKNIFSILFGAVVCTAFVGCDVDVKDAGELPEVDMDVEEGELPDVDVRGPDVEVETEKAEVEVPDVDVDLPGENEKEVDASAEDDE